MKDGPLSVKLELKSLGNPEKTELMAKFFRAVPGGYGEGDRFYAVKVPRQRSIARKYWRLVTLSEIGTLLRDAVHEVRLTALFMLTLKYEGAASEQEKQEAVDLYLGSLEYVNNWDLVDSSAYKILGAHLSSRSRDVLYSLAESGHLWKERVSIIATFHFIKNSDFSDTFALSRHFLGHSHDLIHKAAGWMLREVGKRDFNAEFDFLLDTYKTMPRTMLRYAIEKFDAGLRKEFLAGSIG